MYLAITMPSKAICMRSWTQRSAAVPNALSPSLYINCHNSMHSSEFPPKKSVSAANSSIYNRTFFHRENHLAQGDILTDKCFSQTPTFNFSFPRLENPLERTRPFLRGATPSISPFLITCTMRCIH